VVHYVSSVCGNLKVKNKSELFILSHLNTRTECLTGSANNPGYNLFWKPFIVPVTGT